MDWRMVTRDGMDMREMASRKSCFICLFFFVLFDFFLLTLRIWLFYSSVIAFVPALCLREVNAWIGWVGWTDGWTHDGVYVCVCVCVCGFFPVHDG